MVEQADAAIPTTIGRYQIRSLAAEGAMGSVYIATDPRMKREVAIKILKTRAAESADGRRRFESEAEAIAAVEHPAIVPIYDFGEHEGELYLVMRYLRGGTLEHRLADGPMTLRELAPVLDRIAPALDAVHERNIIHRDVKPANILFDEAGDAYLSDFGIVKVDSDVEHTGFMLLGTPQYMSPEQAQSARLDSRSDVYSLGVVAYHALTGRAPFAAESPLAMAMAHVSKAPTPIREHEPELPKVADVVFARVLAKAPAARHPTAGDFARDIRDLAAGRWYLIKVADAIEPREVGPDPEPIAEHVRILGELAEEAEVRRVSTVKVDPVAATVTLPPGRRESSEDEAEDD